MCFTRILHYFNLYSTNVKITKSKLNLIIQQEKLKDDATFEKNKQEYLTVVKQELFTKDVKSMLLHEAMQQHSSCILFKRYFDNYITTENMIKLFEEYKKILVKLKIEVDLEYKDNTEECSFVASW
jgi:hypothetical protein